jgi:hypothetical protein
LIRRIFFEQNPVRMQALGIKPGDAQRFLSSLGYVCEPLDKDHAEWLAYPGKPADNEAGEF